MSSRATAEEMLEAIAEPVEGLDLEVGSMGLNPYESTLEVTFLGDQAQLGSFTLHFNQLEGDALPTVMRDLAGMLDLDRENGIPDDPDHRLGLH